MFIQPVFDKKGRDEFLISSLPFSLFRLEPLVVDLLVFSVFLHFCQGLVQLVAQGLVLFGSGNAVEITLLGRSHALGILAAALFQEAPAGH